MDDAQLVRRLEGFGDLSRDGQRLVGRQRPAGNHRRQILASHQFHHERPTAQELLDAVDRRDTGVIQRRERLRFASEPRQALGIAGEKVRQDFDGDVAIESGVARTIHLAHASGTDGDGNFVRAEAPSGRQ